MAIRPESVLDAAFRAIRAHSDTLDEEQSVRGVDALSETQLHPIIALGIQDSGLGIRREQCYPALDHDDPSRSKRQRCDLVVLEEEHSDLIDPVLERLERAAAQETLFGSCDLTAIADRPRCAPEDALWIEIKSVAQFACRDGVYVPNHSYSSELTTGLGDDIAKLALDEHIEHACAMLVVFAQDIETIEHDVTTCVSRASAIGLPVRSPLIESGAITDRGGNSAVGIALVPVAV